MNDDADHSDRSSLESGSPRAAVLSYVKDLLAVAESADGSAGPGPLDAPSGAAQGTSDGASSHDQPLGAGAGSGEVGEGHGPWQGPPPSAAAAGGEPCALRPVAPSQSVAPAKAERAESESIERAVAELLAKPWGPSVSVRQPTPQSVPASAPAEVPPEAAAPEAPADPARVDSPADEWCANGRPRWAQQPFQCLTFQLVGLTLLAPLVTMGMIYDREAEQPLKPLAGYPDWLMGLLPVAGQNLKVIDSALWVMPERYRPEMREALRYVISVAGSDWGLACHRVAQVIELNPEQVHWRKEPGKRPWLAGIVIEQKCALLDLARFARQLRANEPSPDVG